MQKRIISQNETIMANPLADKPRGLVAEVARTLGVSWPTAEKLLLQGDEKACAIGDEIERRVRREAEEARAKIVNANTSENPPDAQAK